MNWCVYIFIFLPSPCSFAHAGTEEQKCSKISSIWSKNSVHVRPESGGRKMKKAISNTFEKPKLCFDQVYLSFVCLHVCARPHVCVCVSAFPKLPITMQKHLLHTVSRLEIMHNMHFTYVVVCKWQKHIPCIYWT